VKFLDNKPANVEQSLKEHGGKLDESDYVNLDFLDFAVGVFLNKIELPALDLVWDGFDCTTFSLLSKGTHERKMSNAFMGTSLEAYESNLRYQFKTALYFKLQEANPMIELASENPKASMRFHPLTRSYVEKPASEGGLGQLLIELCMCHFGAVNVKPTYIWHTSISFCDDFYNARDGNFKYKCSLQEGVCGKAHEQVRAPKGQKTKAFDSSVYPKEFSSTHARCVGVAFKKLRLEPEDPQHTSDGQLSECVECGEGGTLILCDQCPRAFHRRCLTVRDRDCREQDGWVCMDCRNK